MMMNIRFNVVFPQKFVQRRIVFSSMMPIGLTLGSSIVPPNLARMTPLFVSQRGGNVVSPIIRLNLTLTGAPTRTIHS